MLVVVFKACVTLTKLAPALSITSTMRAKSESELKAVALGEPAPVKALQLLREFALDIEQHRMDEQQSVYRPLLELSRRKHLTADVDLTELVSEMDADWSGCLYNWSLECIASD